MDEQQQNDEQLRDKKLNPPPETHRTNNGSTPSNSQMNGSPMPEPVEGSTMGVVPKDDSPEILKKRSGPKESGRA